MAYKLGARDESWDGGEAEKSYNLPEDADCWMYKDPDGDPNVKSTYKLPYVSKDGGKHAVWGAITAIANMLSRTDMSGAEKGVVRRKVAAYYKQAAEKYNDDSICVPWERSLFSVHPDILEFERRYGQLGGVERRLIGLEAIETRDNGDKDSYSVTGYASVFDSRSLDLGGFEEVIEPGAFDDVLTRNPDVHLLWDHDTRLVLARTRNNTLHLKADQHGLSYYGKVAPTSYSSDLRVLLDRGDIDQASFAFTVGEQSWEIQERDGEEAVLRRIHRVADLFDATICAQGAYPAASSGIARAYVRSYAGIEQPEIEVPTPEITEVIERSNKLALARARAHARSRI